jgi:TetR/AcrR family fatty acid metabolism transcriptional regulator
MVYRTTEKMARRKMARRRLLLDVATQLFGRHGYHATTVPMIVGEAQSSTGSFYFYFTNKEDVFAAVLEEVGKRISDALNVAIAQKTDPFEQMRAAVRALFLFMAEHPGEARILILESSGLSPRLEKARRDILASHARGVEKALRALSHRLPPVNPVIASHCWVGAVYESARRWLETAAKNRVPAESTAAAVAAFNLGGIGAPQKYRQLVERE